MPLSDPAPREALHSRAIDFKERFPTSPLAAA